VVKKVAGREIRGTEPRCAANAIGLLTMLLGRAQRGKTKKVATEKRREERVHGGKRKTPRASQARMRRYSVRRNKMIKHAPGGGSLRQAVQMGREVAEGK